MISMIPGKIVYVILVLFCLMCTVGEKPPVAIWKVNSAKEYIIYKIYVVHSSWYPKMLAISFKSANSKDTTVCFAEFNDLYMYVGQNIDLEGFTHVCLEAANRGDATFGCATTEGYRDNKTVEEVYELVRESTKPTT